MTPGRNTGCRNARHEPFPGWPTPRPLSFCELFCEWSSHLCRKLENERSGQQRFAGKVIGKQRMIGRKNAAPEARPFSASILTDRINSNITVVANLWSTSRVIAPTVQKRGSVVACMRGGNAPSACRKAKSSVAAGPLQSALHLLQTQPPRDRHARGDRSCLPVSRSRKCCSIRNSRSSRSIEVKPRS